MQKSVRIFFIGLILIVIVFAGLNYTIIGNAVGIGKVVPNVDKFCGRSTYAYCTANEQCTPGGCGDQLCGGLVQYKAPPENCEVKKCMNSTRFPIQCTCYKSLCQWRPE